jgi:hypothetical protein
VLDRARLTILVHLDTMPAFTEQRSHIPRFGNGIRVSGQFSRPADFLLFDTATTRGRFRIGCSAAESEVSINHMCCGSSAKDRLSRTSVKGFLGRAKRTERPRGDACVVEQQPTGVNLGSFCTNSPTPHWVLASEDSEVSFNYFCQLSGGTTGTPRRSPWHLGLETQCGN